MRNFKLFTVFPQLPLLNPERVFNILCPRDVGISVFLRFNTMYLQRFRVILFFLFVFLPFYMLLFINTYKFAII